MRQLWPTTIMYTNNRNWMGSWSVVLLLWLSVTTLALAQQQQPTPSPKKNDKKSVRARRPRRPQPVINAYKPAFTRKGAPRKLSPDQLWDAKPDSTRPNRGPFRLLVYASTGTSVYSAPIRTPGSLSDEHQNRWSAPISLRVMWQTDHRLRLGVETGFVNMYSYSGTANDQVARVRVSAIPILAVFSMSVVKRFALYAGTGPYLINSHLDYGGVTRGSTFSIGWMAAGTYTQPISRNLGIAAEVKWYDATQTDDACLMLQATLVWRALTW
ncbi:hypothetical protein [Fibrella forsythiae]|uniref:Outer membrane protein beta-barrel domain-containing protein n=1 Tax=Fibrella forsythiae TaxID=2817061 RepID=A0ABS3JAR9_9BACT|nr:hypothetical protein [Fibrella forsythiae]MBO0947085.1 hypothetical protein [Fibrella forsythiae]